MATRPLHHDEARRIMWGAGVVAVLILVGIVGAVVQAGGALPLKQYTYVKATFSDVGTLNTNKQVKENGLPVGTVSDISYQDGRALVTLRLDGKHQVYADATATIANGNALGKKYVEFDPGTPQAGALPGDTLSVKHTSGGESLEDVLAVFDPKTRAALQSSLDQLGTGLTGHSQDLNGVLAAAPDLLTDLGRVSRAATAPRADVPGLLSSANRLVGRFRGRQTQIRDLLRNAAATVDAVDADHGQPLRQTVAGLPATLTDAKAALDSLDGPLGDAQVALTHLRPGAHALGRATPALRSFLKTSRSPLDKVPGVAGQAVPAVGDLTTTLQSARPLLSPLNRAVDSADTFLAAFSPYAGDVGRFFSQDALLNGTLHGDDSKHYFAAALTSVGLASVAGIPDPLYRSEPYPCPLAAWNHSTVTNCSGGAR